jgi:hypothetical protein
MRIFATIGPFLAWLYALVLAWSSMHPKPIFEEGWYWPASLMVSYAFSILPMLAAAWVDARLSDKWWRSLACFAVGFGIAFALYYVFMHEGPSGEQNAKLFRQNWFYVGPVWALPAMVCSWLVTMDRKESGMP